MPELKRAAVGFGRGRGRRSGGKEKARPCQKDAQGRNRAKGGREEARGVLDSPEMEKNSGGTAELRGSIPAAWGRDSDESEGEKREGTTAFL